MSASCLKKKDKLDLSKLSARELLLIGESQTLGPKPCTSKSIDKSSRHSSNSTEDEDDDENDVGEMSSEEEEEENSDSENDWEEVDDQHVEVQLKRYGDSETTTTDSSGKSSAATSQSSQLSSIPEGGLEIVIPREGVFKRKSKHELTVEDILRRELNRDRAELQLLMHQTSLLCQIARGLKLNAAINADCVRSVLEGCVKGKSFSSKRLDLAKVERFMKWFRFDMVIDKPSMRDSLEATRGSLKDEEFIAYQIMEKTFLDYNYYVMIFVAFLRYLKIDVRLVISMNVIPIKPPTSELMRKPKRESEENDKKVDSEDDEADYKKSKKGSKKKAKSKSKPGKKSTGNKNGTPKKQKSSGRNAGRKMISSDDEDEEESGKAKSTLEPVKIGQDMWVEVYLIEEERWISVDVITAKVICEKHLEDHATRPLSYVLAFNNDNKIKDVTRRYASDWLTGTQKLRVKSDWLEKTLKPYRGRKTARDKEEDEYLDQHLLSLPIPKSMSEIKGHPLFVLRRHLLKYEGLYPEEPPSVGSIKGEPVYKREYVHTLHTRELWMREARVVRIGEKPYKIVKGRPKYDKLSGARLPEVPSELFGLWQTEDYIPPIAQNGKVPRNDWGNVELFTEKLLPQGCVHLRLPGLQRIAKKLDIDCAPAVVGFDYGAGGSRPAFDGFVVCEEFEETLLDAWNQEQDEKKKRDEEKRLQRIYSNWRRLVKGVLIRDRLEKKYSVNLSGKRKTDKEPQPSSSKRTRKN